MHIQIVSSAKSTIITAKERRILLGRACADKGLLEYDDSVLHADTALHVLEQTIERARLDVQHCGKLRASTKLSMLFGNRQLLLARCQDVEQTHNHLISVMLRTHAYLSDQSCGRHVPFDQQQEEDIVANSEGVELHAGHILPTRIAVQSDVKQPTFLDIDQPRTATDSCTSTVPLMSLNTQELPTFPLADTPRTRRRDMTSSADCDGFCRLSPWEHQESDNSPVVGFLPGAAEHGQISSCNAFSAEEVYNHVPNLPELAGDSLLKYHNTLRIAIALRGSVNPSAGVPDEEAVKQSNDRKVSAMSKEQKQRVGLSKAVQSAGLPQTQRTELRRPR